MHYLYLFISALGTASAGILATFYNQKNEAKKDVSPIYNVLLLGSVFIAWMIQFLFEREVDLAVLPYAIVMAVCYATASIAYVYALKTGPVVLSALILQMSLVGTAVWGFFFWNSKLSWLVAIGLILIVFSLWLCLKKKKAETKKINVKWGIFIALTFLGNAGASVTQKTQQMAFDGKYGSFLMVIAMCLSFLFSLVLYLRSDKTDSLAILKASWYYPVLAAVINYALNVCIILLATSPLSPSLVYPVIAIGSLSITTVFSKFVFKEEMHWWQWLGVGLGAIAVALLSI